MERKKSACRRCQAYPVRLHCILPHPGQADRWNRAAQERNRYLVDHAGVLLAVYDGSPGGTAMTVGYARYLGRKLIVIDPVARVIRGAVRR